MIASVGSKHNEIGYLVAIWGMYHGILNESFKNTYCLPKVYIYSGNTKNTTRQQILKMKWQTLQYYVCQHFISQVQYYNDFIMVSLYNTLAD